MHWKTNRRAKFSYKRWNSSRMLSLTALHLLAYYNTDFSSKGLNDDSKGKILVSRILKYLSMLAIRLMHQFSVLTEEHQLEIKTIKICRNSGTKYLNALLSWKSLQKVRRMKFWPSVQRESLKKKSNLGDCFSTCSSWVLEKIHHIALS